MNNNQYRSVQISMHTFAKELPLVGNAEYLEIEIDLFSHMSREEFMNQVYETANQFWIQMQNGPLRKNTRVEFKRRLPAENAGNK